MIDERRSSGAISIVNSIELKTALISVFDENQLLDVVIVDDPEAVFDAIRDYIPVIAIVEDLDEKLDGVEIVRSIRRSGQSPNIRLPILLIISGASHKRVLAASSSGANQILTTPFTSQKCWKRIEDTLTDTRTFVETKDYVGPERRGRSGAKYGGSDRRSTSKVW